MTVQAGLWTGAGIAFALAVIAGVADWRRQRRRSFDGYGWAPWRGIQVLSFFVAFTCAILAARL